MHVMIAVDGTEADDAAARTAVELFGTDADYTIVSVGSPTPLYALSPLGIAPAMLLLAAGDGPDAAAASEQHAVDAAAHAGLDEVEVISTVGPPGPVVCELAAEHGADVLVIGSHERGWLERLFDPAVGQHIIDNAPCHVLVVRGQGHEENQHE